MIEVSLALVKSEYYTRAKLCVMLLWLYVLAIRSIVPVLSCVTTCWFCTCSCSALTATVINEDYYLSHSYSIYHGTDYKIGLRLSVCVSVRLRALSRSHFLTDFHQNWHRRKNPLKENECVRGQYRTTLFPILPPQETPFEAKRS